MKTVEQKAKAYDGVIGKLQSLINNANKQGHIIIRIEDIENSFPELKESDDDRIRKDIIRVLKGEISFTSEKENEKYIAWLENQDEKDKLIKELIEYKVKYIQETLEKYVNSMNNKDDERLRKTTIAFLKDFAEQGYENAVECIDWLEKQDIFSKKDVDDAYLKGISDAKNEIEKQYEANYQIRKDIATFIFNYRGDLKDRAKWMDYLGIKLSFVKEKQKPNKKIEPKFHEGDFIVNDYCMGKVIEVTNDAYLLDTGQGIPFSYEHKAHLWTIQDAKDGDVLICEDGYPFIYASNHIYSKYLTAYCGITNDGVFKNSDKTELWTNDNVAPATKEQRDLLFQKMSETGYEWDANKKELKKIERKSTWSEEDKHRVKDIIYFLDTAKKHYASTVELDACIDWCKSFKERIIGVRSTEFTLVENPTVDERGLSS